MNEATQEQSVKEDPSNKPFLSVREAAQYLGVNHKTLRDGIRDGVIPSVRLGRKILVPRAGLEELAQRGTVSGQ